MEYEVCICYIFFRKIQCIAIIIIMSKMLFCVIGLPSKHHLDIIYVFNHKIQNKKQREDVTPSFVYEFKHEGNKRGGGLNF